MFVFITSRYHFQIKPNILKVNVFQRGPSFKLGYLQSFIEYAFDEYIFLLASCVLDQYLNQPFTKYGAP